jgi:5-methylthioribose kinase
MRELSAHSAADYLREAGRVPAGAEVEVRELSGGVSNIVLRVDGSGRPPFVLKQCRERLRVAMDWRARLERIWAEQAALELLGTILPEGTVPRVWFDDRSNYLFAMTCAPDDAVTWKSQLLAGQFDPDFAARLGTILGMIHVGAPEHPALRGILADTSHFDELRIDPYYRTSARAHPDLAPRIDALITAMDRPTHERTLVLGDFSPKNILVHKRGLILLDFECAHAGDAAFDVGFFLSHLLLKTIRTASRDAAVAPRCAELVPCFWDAYCDRRHLNASAQLNLEDRAIWHAAACCLARVDGKSPVEYLDDAGQRAARWFAREAFRSQRATWNSLRNLLEAAIDRGMVWRSSCR